MSARSAPASAPRIHLGRLVWVLVVLVYAYCFFRNLFLSAVPARAVVAVSFCYLLSVWMAIEFYFGQPFFQSGQVRATWGLRAAFATFFYGTLVFAAFDYAGFTWSSFAVTYPWLNMLGILVFGAGSVLRLVALRPGSAPYRLVRQPRYLATVLQVVGFPLAFGSLIALGAALVIGLPLVWVQAYHEDRRLAAQGGEKFARYRASVPLLVPHRR